MISLKTQRAITQKISPNTIINKDVKKVRTRLEDKFDDSTVCTSNSSITVEASNTSALVGTDTDKLSLEVRALQAAINDYNGISFLRILERIATTLRGFCSWEAETENENESCYVQVGSQPAFSNVTHRIQSRIEKENGNENESCYVQVSSQPAFSNVTHCIQSRIEKEEVAPTAPIPIKTSHEKVSSSGNIGILGQGPRVYGAYLLGPATCTATAPAPANTDNGNNESESESDSETESESHYDSWPSTQFYHSMDSAPME